MRSKKSVLSAALPFSSLFACVLALFLLCASAQAANFRVPFSYSADGQSISTVLRNFAQVQGYNSEFSPQVQGTVSGRFSEVAPATFGQFTGLLDKNGKRIFEGDIVRKTGGPELKPPIGKVVFENGAFLWAYRNFKLAPFVKSEAIPGYGIFDYQYEIIGNIHDNPELVEGE